MCWQKCGWYDVSSNPPNDWITDNKEVVEKLADEGYKIKVISSFENIEKNIKLSGLTLILVLMELSLI